MAYYHKSLILVTLFLLSFTAGLMPTTSAKSVSNSTIIAQYLLNMNGTYYFSTNIINMVNSTTVKIDSYWIETTDGSTFNQTFILPILALQVPALNEETNLRDPSGQGIWRIKMNTTTNSDIVTNYVSNVSNPVLGFSYNLSMTTLDVIGITSALKNQLVNDKFYLFVPQMLPPNQLPQSTQDPIVIVGGGGGPIGGSLKLLEKDNPQANINLWYLQANLSVSCFTCGSTGYTDSLGAKALSINWFLVSDSISTNENTQQTEVSATGIAEFFGIFLGTWWAYPEVQVNAFVNGTVSGYIHNTIISSSPYYSSSTLFNQDFTGSVTVVQYIL